MSLKDPVTPPGIDPGTVRVVAQRLNHYATSGPILVDPILCYNVEIKQLSAYNVPSKVALTLFDLPKHVANPKYL
jgi:hypothetical protein